MSKLDSIKATLKKMFSMVVVIFLTFIYVSINICVYKNFGVKWILIINTILIGLLIYFFSYRPTAKAMGDHDKLIAMVTDYELTHNTCHLSDDEFLDGMMDWWLNSIFKRSTTLPLKLELLSTTLARVDDITYDVYKERGTLYSLCPISLVYKKDKRIERIEALCAERRNDVLKDIRLLRTRND